jgi:hypothetical protein
MLVVCRVRGSSNWFHGTLGPGGLPALIEIEPAALRILV